jgi:DNA-binding NarL/FixJ family response regulator
VNSSNALGSESNDKTRASGLKVLLVDDSALLRERVAASVSEVAGVALVLQAGDVPSGLQFLAAKPDVVILDIEMPGQSGFDLLKIARRANYTGVIIMLTIHDHPKMRQRSAELGANFYFHKLTEFQQVAEVCRVLVASRGQQVDWSDFGSIGNIEDSQ